MNRPVINIQNLQSAQELVKFLNSAKNPVDTISSGIKYDSEKLRPSLVPTDSLMEIVKVLEFGAKKYAPDNWKLITPHSRYTDAALRHIYAYLMGEKNDLETGLSHLAHASACLMFLIHFELQESKNV